MQQIAEKWDFLCSCSSIFGLTRFHYQKNPFLTLLWIAASLGCLAFGIYLTKCSISDYLEFNVITNIKSVLNIPAIFPAFIICNHELSLSDITYYGFGSESFANLRTAFEVFDDPNFGNCLRFNGFINESVPLRTVNGTDFEENSLFIHLKNGTSAVMFITPNRLNSLFNVSPSYIFPNKSYNFYVRKTIEEKLSEPYNRCLNESQDYHPENCIEQCVNTQFANQYNCSIASYYSNSSLEKCEYRDQYFNRKNLTSYCQTQCVEECYTTTYYSTCLEDSPPDDGSLNIWVLLSDLKYTYVNQIPKMSIFDLVGYVGGTLGLVVGFQFLSLVEIFDFFFEVVLILCRPSRVTV